MNRRTLLQAIPAVIFCSQMLEAEETSNAIKDYERLSGGKIGIYGHNLKTGATLSWRADQRFVMCSTFKASLAALVLSRVDQGLEHLETRVHFGKADLQEHAPAARTNLARGWMTVQEMCEAAVELSDNTCANLLLARVGGPKALTAFWRTLGDNVTRLDHNEPLLNRTPLGAPEDTTTPRAMAGVMTRLVLEESLSKNSRKLFTSWLIGCKTGAKRLRAGLPRTWRIGDKTGNNGKDAVGDLVVAWNPAPIVLCVYTRGGHPTSSQLDNVFKAVGELAAHKLK